MMEIVSKPNYHVCSQLLWEFERLRGDRFLVLGTVVACECGDHFELRDRLRLIRAGKWTISWYQSRLFWVRIKKGPKE